MQLRILWIRKKQKANLCFTTQIRISKHKSEFLESALETQICVSKRKFTFSKHKSAEHQTNLCFITQFVFQNTNGLYVICISKDKSVLQNTNLCFKRRMWILVPNLKPTHTHYTRCCCIWWRNLDLSSKRGGRGSTSTPALRYFATYVGP